MAAAIHLEIMSNILPVNLDGKLDGRTCAVNPSKRRVQTAQARQQPHGRPAQTRKPGERAKHDGIRGVFVAAAANECVAPES
jgi:hypothetical protein